MRDRGFSVRGSGPSLYPYAPNFGASRADHTPCVMLISKLAGRGEGVGGMLQLVIAVLVVILLVILILQFI